MSKPIIRTLCINGNPIVCESNSLETLKLYEISMNAEYAEFNKYIRMKKLTNIPRNLYTIGGSQKYKCAVCGAQSKLYTCNLCKNKYYIGECDSRIICPHCIPQPTKKIKCCCKNTIYFRKCLICIADCCKCYLINCETISLGYRGTSGPDLSICRDCYDYSNRYFEIDRRFILPTRNKDRYYIVRPDINDVHKYSDFDEHTASKSVTEHNKETLYYYRNQYRREVIRNIISMFMRKGLYDRLFMKEFIDRILELMHMTAVPIRDDLLTIK